MGRLKKESLLRRVQKPEVFRFVPLAQERKTVSLFGGDGEAKPPPCGSGLARLAQQVGKGFGLQDRDPEFPGLGQL